jgi:hypothetical protein
MAWARFLADVVLPLESEAVKNSERAERLPHFDVTAQFFQSAP